MKKIIFFALLLGAGYYFMSPYSGTGDNPVANVIDKISSLFSSTNSSSASNELESGKKTTVYKYQDENGQWHFSNQPDGDQHIQTTDSYDINTNVILSIQSSPAPSAKTAAETSTEAKTETNDDISASPLTVYTNPGKIKQLIQDAKSIQQKLNDRKETLDQQIDAQ